MKTEHELVTKGPKIQQIPHTQKRRRRAKDEGVSMAKSVDEMALTQNSQFIQEHLDTNLFDADLEQQEDEDLLNIDDLPSPTLLQKTSMEPDQATVHNNPNSQQQRNAPHTPSKRTSPPLDLSPKNLNSSLQSTRQPERPAATKSCPAPTSAYDPFQPRNDATYETGYQENPALTQYYSQQRSESVPNYHTQQQFSQYQNYAAWDYTDVQQSSNSYKVYGSAGPSHPPFYSQNQSNTLAGVIADFHHSADARSPRTSHEQLGQTSIPAGRIFPFPTAANSTSGENGSRQMVQQSHFIATGMPGDKPEVSEEHRDLHAENAELWKTVKAMQEQMSQLTQNSQVTTPVIAAPVVEPASEVLCRYTLNKVDETFRVTASFKKKVEDEICHRTQIRLILLQLHDENFLSKVSFDVPAASGEHNLPPRTAAIINGYMAHIYPYFVDDRYLEARRQLIDPAIQSLVKRVCSYYRNKARKQSSDENQRDSTPRRRTSTPSHRRGARNRALAAAKSSSEDYIESP